MRVMEHTGSRNEIFNMTFGSAHTIGEMAEIVKEHFPKVNVQYNEKDKLMPDRGTLCMDKARDLIGFEPSWDLATAYPRYISWYKDLAERHPEYFKQ